MAVPARRMRVLWFLVLALAINRPPLTGFAQPATPAVARPAAGSAVVRRDMVRSDFPSGLQFTFDIVAQQPITRIDLLYRATIEQTWSMVEPTFSPAPEVAMTQAVDLQTAAVPPGVDLVYHWRIYEANGAVTDTPDKPTSWTDTRFAWTALTGPHVAVFAHNQDPAFDHTILDVAEQTVATLAPMYDAPATRPIRIWVYDSQQEFGGAREPNAEPGVAGAAAIAYGVILAVLADGDLSEVERVVPHEVSHQLLFAATDNPFGGVPLWLDEGLAVHAQRTGNGQDAAQVRLALVRGQLLDIRALNGSFPYDFQQRLLAYAESDRMVVFILDHWGQAGLRRFIVAFRDGVTPDEAARQALGVDLAQLNVQWRVWLAQQPSGG